MRTQTNETAPNKQTAINQDFEDFLYQAYNCISEAEAIGLEVKLNSGRRQKASGRLDEIMRLALNAKLNIQVPLRPRRVI